MFKAIVRAAVRAARLCRRRRSTSSSMIHAITEPLEARRLMAAPQVVAPPPFPEPGEPLGPEWHFHFEGVPVEGEPGQEVTVSFNQSLTFATGAMTLTNLTTGLEITQVTQRDAEPGPTRAWEVGDI